MTDADILRSALLFLGWQPSDLTSFLEQEGSHSRSTTHRWLKGEAPVPAAVKLLLKHYIMDAIPCAQKPPKTKVIMVCGHNGGVGTSPFAVTLTHFLHDFGLRSEVYHVGRDPIDTRWSKLSWHSSLAPLDKGQSKNHYLPELYSKLSRAGSGELDLDCLVIDVSRRFEKSEHYDAVMHAADAGIVLIRDMHIKRGWGGPIWQLDRIRATGTPAKALVKFEMHTLKQLTRLDVKDDHSSTEWWGDTFFNDLLIDNCTGGEMLDVPELFSQLQVPWRERNSLLMSACRQVAQDTLDMLGLAYIDDISCIRPLEPLPTLETILNELMRDRSEMTAALNRPR